MFNIRLLPETLMVILPVVGVAPPILFPSTIRISVVATVGVVLVVPNPSNCVFQFEPVFHPLPEAPVGPPIQ